MRHNVLKSIFLYLNGNSITEKRNLKRSLLEKELRTGKEKTKASEVNFTKSWIVNRKFPDFNSLT